MLKNNATCTTLCTANVPGEDAKFINERIKEEGRKMVEERQKEAARLQEEANKEAQEESLEPEVPQLG